MKVEKRNSAAVKAEFASVVQKVKQTEEPMIVQKNNIDQVAIVPLSDLEKIQSIKLSELQDKSKE